jgi:2-methylisocitrate lyase-like PEP mutase family enzyme
VILGHRVKQKSDFRRLHEAEGCFLSPNPWDVGTARILALLGYSALAATSAGLAFSLGQREGQVSREATMAHCRNLVTATRLPVSADLEKGFGDSPESCADTILTAADIGLAGCSNEDHTGIKDDPIYTFDLARERILAACEARDTLKNDFVVTARCENFSGTDLIWPIRKNAYKPLKRLVPIYFMHRACTIWRRFAPDVTA